MRGDGGRGGSQRSFSRGRGSGSGFSSSSPSSLRGSSQWSGGYRPMVAEESPSAGSLRARESGSRETRAEGGLHRGGAGGYRRGGGGGDTGPRAAARRPFSSDAASASTHFRNGAQEGRVPRPKTKAVRNVVVILEKAGLLLGHMGLVDAYDRAATTELTNESLMDVRPDIVHQCLLALFDSDLAYQRRLRVYISLFTRSGKVVEVSPALRPPRTYNRFRGLISVLLRDGRVCSTDGQVLMRLMPGSVAPVIPHGAEVVGLTNSVSAPITTATQLAQDAVANPVDDALQGGIKNITAFYCISCTDDCNMDGIDYVTRSVCLSAYPMSSHVQCARICEGHSRVEPDVGNAPVASSVMPVEEIAPAS